MSTSIEQACEARLGQVLKGKWTLERTLGIGGMAAVYVALHKIGRREAIKILHPEVARDAEQRRRFEQEARAANTLTHPGMVEVRDIDVTEDGCPFMVMELLEGETLTEMANRLGGLPVPDLLRFVDEILDVLAVAHEHGIVHRDIKLGNLFVTTEGRIKVLDFGIARLAASQITRVGARLGTAAYMPPEQIRGEQVDGRADLFAVGATMFRLLAKRRVHEAPTEPELLVKMATVPAPLLATVCDAPADVCLVVDRALAYRAADRYPDARTMQIDVQALRRGERPPYASSAAAGGAPDRAAATLAAAPAGRVVGAASASAPTLVGPASTTLPTGAAPNVARRAAPDAYAPTGYDLAPPSARGAPPPGAGAGAGASALASAPTILPHAALAHGASAAAGGAPSASAATVLGAAGAGVPAPASPHDAPPVSYAVPPPAGPASMRSSMAGPPPSSFGGPAAVVAPGPAAIVAPGPASMGRPPASVAHDDTALALPAALPVAARSGPSPLVLAGIGGAVFFVLAVVLLFAVSGDETDASASPSATASAGSSAPRTSAPPVAPARAPPGPPGRGAGHPSQGAPGRGR